MSNAITIWRNACTYTDVDPELVHQICRGSSDAPVSWRFTVTGAIANQIDAPPKVFDESWDSPRNSYYRNHKLYRDTFAFAGTREGEDDDDSNARIMAIRGEDTAFDALCEGLKVEDLPDDAIVICEVRDSGIHWMQPGDLEIAKLPRLVNPKGELGISGNFPGGFFVGFADGSVGFLDETVPFGDLEKFLTISGAKNHEREEVLGKYALDRLGPRN